MLHSFHLPKWEADQAKQKAEALPAELTEGLRVIPATLVFDLPPNTGINGGA